MKPKTLVLKVKSSLMSCVSVLSHKFLSICVLVCLALNCLTVLNEKTDPILNFLAKIPINNPTKFVFLLLWFGDSLPAIDAAHQWSEWHVAPAKIGRCLTLFRFSTNPCWGFFLCRLHLTCQKKRAGMWSPPPLHHLPPLQFLKF